MVCLCVLLFVCWFAWAVSQRRQDMGCKHNYLDAVLCWGERRLRYSVVYVCSYLFVIIIINFVSGRPSLVYTHESAGVSSHSTQTTSDRGVSTGGRQNDREGEKRLRQRHESGIARLRRRCRPRCSQAPGRQSGGVGPRVSGCILYYLVFSGSGL